MITIVTIDEETLERAARVTGIREKTAVVRKGLESLIAAECAKRLAALGGSGGALRGVPRRGVNAGESRGAEAEAGVIPHPHPIVQGGGAAADSGVAPDVGGNGR